jgi:hypothetical protein
MKVRSVTSAIVLNSILNLRVLLYGTGIISHVHTHIHTRDDKQKKVILIIVIANAAALL